MAEGAGIGLRLDSDDIAQLFGEDQARYLLACDAAGAKALLAAAASIAINIAAARFFCNKGNFTKS